VLLLPTNGLKAIQALGMGGLNSAIVLITIGWSKHKKKTDDTSKFKTIAIFYGLGLLLILSRIPWTQWF